MTYSSQDPPSPQKVIYHGVKFVMSALEYIIVLRETYKVKILKYHRWHGINKYMPSVQYIFLRKPMYKIQMQNIFIEMVTHFKDNSQWACSVSNLFLIGGWKYCTQSYQCTHALPQYVSKISMKFEYKLYKLFRLLSVTN